MQVSAPPPPIMNWADTLPKSLTARHDGVATVLKYQPGGKGARNSSELVGVVVAGGRSSEETSLDTVEFYECKLRRWWQFPPLSMPRCGCMVATVNHNIFVAGGIHEENQLDCVEKYAFGTGAQQWEVVASMSSPRWYGALVGLPRHNLVLVVGGRNDAWKELATVEAYNIEKNTWLPLQSMSTPRFGCAAVALSHSKILVLGGYNGKEWTTTGEVYDFETDKWTSTDVTPMPHAVRFCVAATVVQSGKFVFVSGQIHIDASDKTLMQCYNVDENKWAVLNCSKDLSGSALASIGQHLFALGGFNTPSAAPASADNGADDQNNIISQLTRSWKLSDIDFSRLWTDGSKTVPRVRDPQHHDDNHTQAQYGHRNQFQQTGGYVVTSLVAVPVDDPSPPASVISSGLQSHPNNVRGSFGFISSAASASQQDMDARSAAESSHQHFARQPDAPFGAPPVYGSSQYSLSAQSVSTPIPQGPVGALAATSASSMFNSSMSVASSHSETPRRMVEAESMTDNYGAPVVYTGQVAERSGKPDGKGRMTWTSTGDIYVGSFRNGSRDGNGRMTYKNGDTFQGIYKDDQRDGHGVFNYVKEHRTYDGLYVDDEQEDVNGTMTWNNGTIYIGQFRQSKRTGKGMVRFPNQVKYTGDFVNGKYHGFGICKFSDGSVYDGQWRKGKAHGQGKLVDARGRVVHDGGWINDGPLYG
jgi:hypothetical protein